MLSILLNHLPLPPEQELNDILQLVLSLLQSFPHVPVIAASIMTILHKVATHEVLLEIADIDGVTDRLCEALTSIKVSLYQLLIVSLVLLICVQDSKATEPTSILNGLSVLMFLLEDDQLLTQTLTTKEECKHVIGNRRMSIYGPVTLNHYLSCPVLLPVDISETAQAIRSIDIDKRVEEVGSDTEIDKMKRMIAAGQVDSLCERIIHVVNDVLVILTNEEKIVREAPSEDDEEEEEVREVLDDFGLDDIGLDGEDEERGQENSAANGATTAGAETPLLQVTARNED